MIIVIIMIKYCLFVLNIEPKTSVQKGALMPKQVHYKSFVNFFRLLQLIGYSSSLLKDNMGDEMISGKKISGKMIARIMMSGKMMSGKGNTNVSEK